MRFFCDNVLKLASGGAIGNLVSPARSQRDKIFPKSQPKYLLANNGNGGTSDTSDALIEARDIIFNLKVE